MWQFPAASATYHLMPCAPLSASRAFGSATALVLGALAQPSFAVPAVPGGIIGTLEIGDYACELPGDAAGPIRIAADDFNFRIVRGSSYRVGGARGSYLLTGDIVTMTGGKLAGLKLRRISNGFLRQIDKNGNDGEMRCVLAVPGNT